MHDLYIAAKPQKLSSNIAACRRVKAAIARIHSSNRQTRFLLKKKRSMATTKLKVWARNKLKVELTAEAWVACEFQRICLCCRRKKRSLSCQPQDQCAAARAPIPHLWFDTCTRLNMYNLIIYSLLHSRIAKNKPS